MKTVSVLNLKHNTVVSEWSGDLEADQLSDVTALCMAFASATGFKFLVIDVTKLSVLDYKVLTSQIREGVANAIRNATITQLIYVVPDDRQFISFWPLGDGDNQVRMVFSRSQAFNLLEAAD